MKIDFFNYSKVLEKSRKEMHDALDKIINHGRCILGPEVIEFEEKFAKLDNEKYCVGVSNGTDALYLIIQSLNLPPNSKILVPSFTFIASASVILKAGHTPIFIDIEKDAFHPGLKQIKEACNLESGIRAMIFVNLFGEYNDLAEIREFCDNQSIVIIEDCAQSFGTPNSECSIARSFSFFPAKNLGCLGDAGAVTTNSKEIRDEIIKLRQHGSVRKYEYEILGGNYRMDTLQAAFLSIHLNKADDWVNSRRANAETYFYELNGLKNIILPSNHKGNSFNQFTILTDKRQELKDFLAKEGVPSMIYYPKPLHSNVIFNKERALPETNSVCNRCLSLPIYPELTEEEIVFASSKIKEFYRRK